MKNEPEKFTIWHGLFFGEFFALLVALATTIIPTKTGSKYGISGLFFDEPTFLQEFIVNLVGINVMLLLLGIGIAIWVKASSPQSPSSIPPKRLSQLDHSGQTSGNKRKAPSSEVGRNRPR